ncbi:hypothetical protein Leryth_017898 [Lithospermum erythrorhizon]|nr:hypothetical protein Leryth_017898 [Lithospermum erythrorhizon]
MIQICSILPVQKVYLCQATQSNFKYNASPLKSLKSKPTLDVKKHIKNLVNLIPKSEPSQRVLPNKGAEENIGGSLLGGLNLARVWPERKAAEEMSPRNLSMLKRLLSKSNMEYSPRNILGSMWRDYHGCNNWSGLLDPLDENLRREIVRYDEFIQASYHCFHSDPATDEAPIERHVALPDGAYKVTKSLYVTSSMGLPKWHPTSGTVIRVEDNPKWNVDSKTLCKTQGANNKIPSLADSVVKEVRKDYLSNTKERDS